MDANRTWGTRRRHLLQTIASIGAVSIAGCGDFLSGADSPIEAEWEFMPGSRLIVSSSSPTVVDGTIYIGFSDPGRDIGADSETDDALFAVDAETGEEEWTFTEPSNHISGSPAVADGTVYVGSSDRTLYAVDARTGEEEWSFAETTYDTTPDSPGGLDQISIGGVGSSPTVANGTVYVGARDETLYAVDAETGEEEWAFTEPSHGVESSPTVADGTVYVGSNDETLYAVDAGSGEQKWAFTEPAGIVRSSPTIADGTVFVGSHDGNLYAVDADTGEQQWMNSFTEPSGYVDSSPTVADGIVYVGCYDANEEGTLWAVDATTGRKEWEFGELSRGIMKSSPTVADGIVYIGTFGGTIIAVDAQTGDEEWTASDLSGSTAFGFINSSPTVVDGLVYFGSGELLYALDADIEGSSEDSRVMLGTLGHHDKAVDS